MVHVEHFVSQMVDCASISYPPQASDQFTWTYHEAEYPFINPQQLEFVLPIRKVDPDLHIRISHTVFLPSSYPTNFATVLVYH